MYDVIIVGGGMAGMSAALILGRCRRRVLVVDSGRPRNGASAALHGLLTRDGTDPWEMRRIGRQELKAYPDVRFLDGEVTAAYCLEGRFEVVLKPEERFASRILLVATGLEDKLPPIEGIDAFYGKSVFHCPYCDGWENRDRPLAVLGRGDEGVAFALELLVWSRDLVLCTQGEPLSDAQRRPLESYGILHRQERVLRLEGSGGRLERLVFSKGAPLERETLFFLAEQEQRSPLLASLGCEIRDGMGVTGDLQQTNIPGLYVAGDAARSVKLAVVAAAEGAEAAFAINSALFKADFAGDD